MIKYPFALKLRIINEFISGNKKLEQLALDFGVEDVSLLQQWIQDYERMGSEGLVSDRERQAELKSSRGHKNVYSITFKKNVVNLYLSSSMSYAEVAKQFNLKNARLINDWVKQAVEGRLIEKKFGRPQKQEMMVRKTIQDEDKDKQIQNLKEQLLQTQLELDYLKVQRSLGIAKEIKKKPQSSSSSEKNIH